MPDFPKTGYLSLFLDPPENPLSEGGRWAQTYGGRPPMRKSGGAATYSLANPAPNYSHWALETFDSGVGDDAALEVWACTAGGQLGAALETWRVAMWYTVGDYLSGYLLYYGGGIGKEFRIRRYNGAGGIDDHTSIAQSGGGYPEKIGLRIVGDQVEAWAQYSGVWSFQVGATDTTFRGRFRLGIAIEDPTSGGSPSLAMPCFGGGVPRRTQFFRWTRGFKEPAAE